MKIIFLLSVTRFIALVLGLTTQESICILYILNIKKYRSNLILEQRIEIGPFRLILYFLKSKPEH